MFSTFRNTAISLGAAVMLIGVAGPVRPANATFIATMEQVGANVVITGSGSFDTVGLTPTSPFAASATAFVEPIDNALFLGGGGTQNAFTGLTPPATFGGGALTLASSTSGAVLGIADAAAGFNSLYLPNGYVSGTTVSDLTTFAGASFTSLGVTPGTYTWRWGSGANADSFTLDIGVTPAVPEPGSLPLLAGALVGLVMLLTARRSRPPHWRGERR
jgi:hypothetical protein